MPTKYQERLLSWIGRNMNIEVRMANATDSTSVGRLFCELYLLHFEGNSRIFKDPNGNSTNDVELSIANTVIATVESKVVGYLKYSEKVVDESRVLLPRRMLIADDLIVRRDYRNLGIGMRLLNYLEDIGTERGFDSVEIPVFSFNNDAHGFYEHQGYTEYVRRYRKEI
jgi:GNAT superfamily N-acetyltransferase